MAIENFFDSASRIMTVVSFITFAGIVWWTYVSHKKSDFDAAAQLPFVDDDDVTMSGEPNHV
jgi:cytochrome c oxidase cbb3-type subunit IV